MKIDKRTLTRKSGALSCQLDLVASSAARGSRANTDRHPLFTFMSNFFRNNDARSHFVLINVITCPLTSCDWVAWSSYISDARKERIFWAQNVMFQTHDSKGCPQTSFRVAVVILKPYPPTILSYDHRSFQPLRWLPRRAILL